MLLTKFLKTKEIRDELQICNPHKIAVAYIGADWADYINSNRIEEIILSPTLGSNPKAIDQLVEELGGWDKIYFLKNLHTKIYIGSEIAIVGSSNLSKNGIDVGGLEEACISVRSPELSKDINHYFETLKSKASRQFKDEKSKKQELEKLRDKWAAAESAGIGFDASTEKEIYEYGVPAASDEFYICFFDDYDGYSHSKEVSKNRVDDFHFSPKDELRKNKWVLSWEADEDGNPTGTMDWGYIHRIIPGGIVAFTKKGERNYPYTTAAIQEENGFGISTPRHRPFKLTRLTKKAFVETMREKRFHDAFYSAKKTWLVKNSFKQYRNFMEAWIINYRLMQK